MQRYVVLCSRGAVECKNAIGGNEPGETLCTQEVQRLMAACDTLKESASGLIQLGYREQAAEAYMECAEGLRCVDSLQTCMVYLSLH